MPSFTQMTKPNSGVGANAQPSGGSEQHSRIFRNHGRIIILHRNPSYQGFRFRLRSGYVTVNAAPGMLFSRAAPAFVFLKRATSNATKSQKSCDRSGQVRP